MLFMGQGANRNRPDGTSACTGSGTRTIFTSASAEPVQRIRSQGGGGGRRGGSRDRSSSRRRGRGCCHRRDGRCDTWAAPGKKGTETSRSTTAASAGAATTTDASGSSTATGHTQGHIQQGFLRMPRRKGLYGEVERHCARVKYKPIGHRNPRAQHNDSNSSTAL